MTANRILIGIDVGGTFTDAVVLDATGSTVLMAFKLLSTPADPGTSVITALRRIAGEIGVRGALVCHGTTVGTNTLIERKGAKVGLLASAGFTDVIELRRQNRPLLYDLSVRVSEPLVPRELRFGVSERMDAEGQVIKPLDGLAGVIDQLRGAGIESVAIAFLHSYANPTHEQQALRVLEQAFPDVFFTASSDVCPEFREFERTSTTVVNAYIGPSVGRYIRAIAAEARAMGVQDLLIVKSNGGLTSPENAARYPVHLIESGPAAGMIATAAYARATGRKNVIAFDMGGTTAKVGVVQDFNPKVTDEFLADQLANGRNVGGYPIRSAVLDIIEIGAGGGSVAWIDAGGVLKVGPESAGADPGPACYSRGGSIPTVTDAHAVIGTLSQETFEGSGVAFCREHAVKAIGIHIAEPMGWSIAKAAHSIIELAVANMTEMVRLATVRRGLDPREFSLLASGGAGPLHAGLVGVEAGTKEVIVPPYPGMFSALGAVLGEVRHDLSQTMLGALKEFRAMALESAFARLKEKADALLAKEPQGVAQPAFMRFAHLRFAGQLFELRVPLGTFSQPIPACAEVERRFRALYVSEFGFDLAESVVQLVNLHLVASLPMGGATARIFASESAPSAAAQPYRVQAYLRADGCEEPLPVYRTAECIGAELAGPLLIEHSGSTVWVRDGQRARIGPDGGVVFQIQGDRQMDAPLKLAAAMSILEADPVTFEVVKSALYAICTEMKSVIMRTSFSPLLSLSADLSCVLLDRDCNVIAQGVDIPVHLGAARFTALSAVKAFPREGWRESDAVLLNDPYEGGTHLPDMSLLTPVFVGGTLISFVLSRIHWPDIGGIAAGSSSVCDEIIKEGLRVPPVKIIEAGVLREDVLRLILANVRVPLDRKGDFQAARAGHARATERMRELCERYGAGVVTAVMADTLSYSRRLVAARLVELPDADVSNEETLDGDGIDPDAAPLVKVRIRKVGASMSFDFTGSSPCVRGPINAPIPITSAAVYYTLLSFVGGDIAPNSGVYAGVEIIAPEGTVVHATYPAPVVAANTETANRMVDILMGALAKAYPDRVAAGSYGSACVYTFGGFDPVRKRPFVHYETIGGGMGATASGDGPGGLRVHMGNTMNLPIEGIEAALPVRFLNYEIVPESEGCGLHRGGGGVRKSFETLVDGIEASVLGERTRTPAHGVAGGGKGGLARFRLIARSGTRELAAKSGPHILARGDRLEMTTAGGGGWGVALKTFDQED